MSRLSDRYPNNPTFLMLRAGLATRLSSFRNALKFLDIFNDRIKSKTPYYPETKLRILNYRYGDVYFKKRDYTKALSYFNKSIKPMDEDLDDKYYRYKVYSLLGSARTYVKLNRFDEAKDHFEKVLDLTEVRDSHTWAEEGLNKINITKAGNISN